MVRRRRIAIRFKRACSSRRRRDSALAPNRSASGGPLKAIYNSETASIVLKIILNLQIQPVIAADGLCATQVTALIEDRPARDFNRIRKVVF